jgi:outer membrane scaffolding protein for murein synthesis (MipA/OmpV family)
MFSAKFLMQLFSAYSPDKFDVASRSGASMNDSKLKTSSAKVSWRIEDCPPRTYDVRQRKGKDDRSGKRKAAAAAAAAAHRGQAEELSDRAVGSFLPSRRRWDKPLAAAAAV